MGAELDENKVESYLPPDAKPGQPVAETVTIDLRERTVRAQVFDVRGQFLGEAEELSEK